jgi:hypothetical protein
MRVDPEITNIIILSPIPDVAAIQIDVYGIVC